LGKRYAAGEGVPQDTEEAVNWFRLSAQKDAEAQYLLGLAYLKGEGVPQNREKALEWLKKSAEQEYEAAQRALRDHEK
jgi:TPR repeat protein